MATAFGSATGREMTVGSVLSRGFAAVGAAPLTFFGTSFLLVALPGSLIGVVARSAMRPFPFVAGTNPYAGIWPTILGTGIAWWLLYLAAQALLFRAAVAELDGRPAPLSAYADAAARSLLPLLGLSILLSLAVWFGMILLFVPGIMLAIIWSVAAPALVAERIGVFASLGRSSRLTRGARWRVFGLVMLVFVIYWLAAATVGVGNIAVNGVASATSFATTPAIVSTVLSVALQTAFVALWTAIQAALYVELRDWKDGPVSDRLADIFA